MSFAFTRERTLFAEMPCESTKKQNNDCLEPMECMYMYMYVSCDSQLNLLNIKHGTIVEMMVLF